MTDVNRLLQQKGPREGEPFAWCETISDHLTSAGNLPPFAASFAITCLCSQIFMLVESLVSPV
jgi:hypothetical protein